MYKSTNLQPEFQPHLLFTVLFNPVAIKNLTNIYCDSLKHKTLVFVDMH